MAFSKTLPRTPHISSRAICFGHFPIIAQLKCRKHSPPPRPLCLVYTTVLSIPPNPHNDRAAQTLRSTSSQRAAALRWSGPATSVWPSRPICRQKSTLTRPNNGLSKSSDHSCRLLKGVQKNIVRLVIHVFHGHRRAQVEPSCFDLLQKAVPHLPIITQLVR